MRKTLHPIEARTVNKPFCGRNRGINGIGIRILLATVLPCTAAVTFAQSLPITGQIPERPTPKDASWGDTLKTGFNRFTKAVLPKEKPSEKIDELSLSRKAQASPELHVALAQACQQRGETQNAIAEYEKALKIDPKHEDTLLKYARFYDQINQVPQAEELYQKATQIHSRSAKVFNHQGLFHVRHKRYAEAAQSFSTAVTLEPMKESYRGNLAVVLVDLGKNKEAYKQLRAIQSSDMAYYNLGYLLQERGRKELAIKHFQVALQKNPGHKEARIWLAHLLEQSTNAEPILQNTVTPQPRIAREVPSWDSYKAPAGPNQSSARPPQPLPNLDTPPLPTSQPIPTPSLPQPQQIVGPQPPVVPSTPPWQPSLPPEMTGPVRTYSHYRTTIPPTRQQPYAIPDPSATGRNVPIQNRGIPVSPNRPTTLLPPVRESASTQAEPPSLVAPAGNRVIARRLPPTFPRCTVNSSSDRYITPLPPVNWSNQFKDQR